jgi:hypothetical protein
MYFVKCAEHVVISAFPGPYRGAAKPAISGVTRQLALIVVHDSWNLDSCDSLILESDPKASDMSIQLSGL